MTETFASRLKALMDDHQLNGSELSKKIGVSQQAVSKWLHGGNVEFACLRALGDYFNVDWVWLGFGDEELKRRGELRSSDILERRRQTHIHQVMESEERLKGAMEAARIATWEWNLISDEIVHSTNNEQIFGTEVHRFEQFMALVPESEHPVIRQALEQALETPGTYEVVHYFLNPATGQQQRIAERGQVICDYDGRPVRILGVSIDVSEGSFLPLG